jgi:non-heme chloroperoxidase
MTPLALIAVAAATTVQPELRTRMVTAADGVPLWTVECGDPSKPAALLLHGFSLSVDSWRPLMTPRNCARWHLVAFDQRGHGRSGKPWTADAYANRKWADDIAAVMTATGLVRPVLVGWSFGGYAAMDYVRAYGGTALAGVQIVGSNAGLVERSRPQGAAAAKQAELGRLQASADAVDNIAGAAMFVGLMTARPLEPPIAEAMRASLLMLPPYARAQMRSHNLDNRDLVRSLDVPVQVALGAADASVAIPPVEAMAAASDGRLRVTVYPGAGHMAFADAPALFERDLSELMAVAGVRPEVANREKENDRP